MALTVVNSNAKWSCTRCTFEQSALNDQCQLCGEKNKSIVQSKPNINNNNPNNPKSIAKPKPNPNPKPKAKQYGSIIYQIERFSDNQLKKEHSLYLRQPNISTSSWSLFIFGDNDIDKSRPNGTDREMLGGQAGIAGKYDRDIAYGIITTFYAYKPMPDYSKFRDIINQQFNNLYNKYLINGHNLIIPSPNKKDLKQHFNSFYECINKDDDNPMHQQVIYHNIGTGIARLPLVYLKYIQYKLDHLDKLSYQHNEGLKSISAPLKNNKAINVVANQNDDNKAIIDDKKDNDYKMRDNQLKKDDIKDDNDKKIDFSANDPIEACVNPDIDIWTDAIFIGYSDSNQKNQCFLEIIRKNKDNHFMEMDVKYIRFKAVNDNDNDNKDDNKDNPDKDEWESVDDFVLKEYIRDVFDELSSDLLNSLDEFMRRMTFLGVYSAKSRSRALNILEEMKNNKDTMKLVKELQDKENKVNNDYKQQLLAQNDQFIAAEIAKKIADGHVLEVFECIRCKIKQEYGGIELRNCNHRICYKCFPEIVSNHIVMKMVPTCIKCGNIIHQTDIKIHINQHTSDIVGDMSFKDMMSKQKDLHNCFDKNCNGCIIIEDKWMKEYRCPVCNERNCIKCKKIHKGNTQCYVAPPPKPIRPVLPVRPYKPYNRYNNKQVNNGNYHITIQEFYGNWVNIQDIKYSSMIQSFDVPYQCDEWNKIILHIRDPNRRKVERIQRIQHAKIWRSFWGYCNRSKSKKSQHCRVGGFWHGTRTCKPDKIWKIAGFDKNHARIGGCLWYATENTYSMNGFQHVRSDGKHQVFLAFVATGNRNDCKFIRNDKILNVYKNEATYPAYLLTYKNG